MGTNELPFQIIYAHAAGIDVGSRSHLVAVDQNKENVREFGVYTKDHQALISHLPDYGITTIAMESTGSWSENAPFGKLYSMPCSKPDLRCCWWVGVRPKM